MHLDVTSPTILFDVASAILACASEALNTNCDEPPARACVIVGNPVHDDCCDGQLTVGITRVAPSRSFPFEDQAGISPCDNTITLGYIDVTLLRCAPTVEDDGTAPDCVLLAQSALQVYMESRMVWSAVRCCLNELSFSGVDVAIQSQDTVDPEGGCTGTVLHVLVGFPDQCGCS